MEMWIAACLVLAAMLTREAPLGEVSPVTIRVTHPPRTGPRVRVLMLVIGVLFLGAVFAAVHRQWEVTMILASAGLLLTSMWVYGVPTIWVGPAGSCDLGEQLGVFQGEIELAKEQGEGTCTVHEHGLVISALLDRGSREGTIINRLLDTRKPLHCCLPISALAEHRGGGQFQRGRASIGFTGGGRPCEIGFSSPDAEALLEMVKRARAVARR